MTSGRSIRGQPCKCEFKHRSQTTRNGLRGLHNRNRVHRCRVHRYVRHSTTCTGVIGDGLSVDIPHPGFEWLDAAGARCGRPRPRRRGGERPRARAERHGAKARGGGGGDGGGALPAAPVSA